MKQSSKDRVRNGGHRIHPGRRHPAWFCRHRRSVRAQGSISYHAWPVIWGPHKLPCLDGGGDLPAGTHHRHPRRLSFWGDGCHCRLDWCVLPGSGGGPMHGDQSPGPPDWSVLRSLGVGPCKATTTTDLAKRSRMMAQR